MLQKVKLGVDAMVGQSKDQYVCLSRSYAGQSQPLGSFPAGERVSQLSYIHHNQLSHACGEGRGYLFWVQGTRSFLRNRASSLRHYSDRDRARYPRPMKGGSAQNGSQISKYIFHIVCGNKGHGYQNKPQLPQDRGPWQQLRQRCYPGQRWQHWWFRLAWIWSYLWTQHCHRWYPITPSFLWTLLATCVIDIYADPGCGRTGPWTQKWPLVAPWPEGARRPPSSTFSFIPSLLPDSTSHDHSGSLFLPDLSHILVKGTYIICFIFSLISWVFLKIYFGY